MYFRMLTLLWRKLSFKRYCASKIHRQFIKQNTDILIIGNSLTREGINESILKEMLIPNQIEIGKVSIIYLDDTSIIEWYYIFKSYFYDNGNYPRKLILNFALDQLSSQELEFEELSRISSYVPFKNFTPSVKRRI